MNKLQQEIKDFHEQLKPTLKRVLEQYDKKAPQKIYRNVILPCRSLIQKCSFKSNHDMHSLCSLAYWLYIYEYKQLALEICEVVRRVNFVCEYRHSGILNIYGLEIRIARELFGENRKNNIQSQHLDYFFSKTIKKSLRYPQILREKEVYDCKSEHLEFILITALYDIIGKGETGLYTELNENRDKIEVTIIEYIDLLKKQ
jgi:hypothetical protein